MDLAKFLEVDGFQKDLKELSHPELIELIELITELEKRETYAGHANWFKDDDGPYGLSKLPKHRAAITATASYREVLVLGGNRSGKTNLGAYITSILTTGQYPEWWDGIRFDHPIQCWVAGKTGQTTRDTVQKALMGEIGNFGTGMIPGNCIGKTVALPGTPNALDSVLVKHVSGGWSSIGFKSYKQEVHSFFGTAKHWIHLDEPCPELIYNECLIRTMTTGGKIFHTITPKDGLTRLLADFLSDCDLLAGTQSLPGLEIAKALIEQEMAGKSRND